MRRRRQGRPSLSQATPVEIEKRGASEIRIVWDDGHVSTWPNRALRLACRCASCIDEWTGERRLQSASVPADVHPVGVALVGNYAVHFEWSDGHGTGIYAYEFLRSICPCDACGAGRREDPGEDPPVRRETP
jgi:DUF971 family protein